MSKPLNIDYPCPRCPGRLVACLWDGVRGWVCVRCGGFWKQVQK